MNYSLAARNVSPRYRACKNCQLIPLCHSGHSDTNFTVDLSLLARHSSSVVKKGMIFIQDAPFTTCFVVRSGAAKTFHVDERGNEKVLAFYLPGQIFGFDGIASGFHACSAIALERSQLCRLSLRQMECLTKNTPELAYRVIKAMSGELNAAERMNRWLSQNTAEERVVGFLLDFARRHQRCHLRGDDFQLPMPRRDIANYLGLALETVSRIFARLHRQRIIEVHGRNVQLLQMQQLKELVCADDFEEAEVPGFSNSHRAGVHSDLSFSN